MFENEKKSPLDRLKKGLYSRNDVREEAPRHEIHGKGSDVPNTWERPEPKSIPQMVEMSKAEMRGTRRVYSYLFLGALFFFLVAVLYGAYTIFGGRNFISADNVDILIEGPSATGGGERLSLNASVVNKNSTDIEYVDLIVEYPDGTKESLDPSKDLTKERVALGNINSQSIAQKTFNALLFGEEGDTKDIKFTAEYRTKGSNAIFFKEKIYRISISSSPVTVRIGALDKVLGGQATDVVVTVSSNTTETVKNLLLSLDYPFGLSVVSSNPPATYDNNVWRIGDLAPGAKRIISLKVLTEGQNEEERTIRASLGIQSQKDEKEIATNIVSRSHTYTIEKPFLGLDLAFDGNRGDFAAEPGSSVRGEIIWMNNSASRITDVRLEAKLTGNVLDKSSVTVDGGYYDSLSNTLIWESGRTSGLDSIAPGEDGRVSFSFRSTNPSPGQAVLNPLITATVSAKAGRVSDSGSSEEIVSAVTRSVKLLTNLSLSSRALRTQGPISNSGPIPPKVDEVTTYTIVWTVTNTSNNITGAKVTASLPPNVTWTGTISPTDANIIYNDSGGNITWNIGGVPRNANVGSGAKQVYFQVSLRPSANQVNSAPQLVGAARITGTDAFTGVSLEGGAPSLSTRTSTDLLYKEGDGLVQN